MSFLMKGVPVELDSKRKKYLIEKIASIIVKYEMETPALLFLESLKPVAHMGVQMALPFFAPYMGLLGKDDEIVGNELIALFMERGNVELILKKIENLSPQTKPKPKSKNSEPNQSLWKRLKKVYQKNRK